MGDETLKPCPFCGGKAEFLPTDPPTEVSVGCFSSKCPLADVATEWNDKETVTAYWNTRADEARIRAEAAAEERARIVMWLRASAEENRRAADTFHSVSVQMEARAHECESRAEGIELGEHLDPDAFPKPGSAT